MHLSQGYSQGKDMPYFLLTQKGFLLVFIGELGLKEFEPEVKELVDVEDKVILPFEGKKWVKLGDIARETLEKLAG
jgi:hypothetical protein